MTTAVASPESTKMIPWWIVLIEGIAALVIGVLLLQSPVQTTVFLIQVLGIYWLITGIMSLVGIFIDSRMWGWKLFAGILGVAAGILIIQHPWWSAILVPTTLIIVIAIQGIIIGAIGLFQAFKGAGWGAGILGVISIIFGIILLGSPVIAAATLPFILGIFGIVGGIAAIIMAFRMR